MTDERKWITVSQAAQLTGYNEEHIARLCRQGRIKARKYSIVWQVDRDSLSGYVNNVEKMGDKRGPKPKGQTT